MNHPIVKVFERQKNAKMPYDRPYHMVYRHTVFPWPITEVMGDSIRALVEPYKGDAIAAGFQMSEGARAVLYSGRDAQTAPKVENIWPRTERKHRLYLPYLCWPELQALASAALILGGKGKKAVNLSVCFEAENPDDETSRVIARLSHACSLRLILSGATMNAGASIIAFNPQYIVESLPKDSPGITVKYDNATVPALISDMSESWQILLMPKTHF